jgi:hypothetical protein
MKEKDIVRKEIQQQIQNKILEHKRCVILASPRLGKCRIILTSFKNIPGNILISVPEESIKQSWFDECDKIGFNKERLTLICHSSLHKIEENFPIVCIDEGHASLTEKRLFAIKKNFLNSKYLVVMSGSFTQKHLEIIKFNLNLNLVYDYSFEKAIKDGIISNYEIEVYKVPLFEEERKIYNKLSNSVEWCREFGTRLQLKFSALKRSRFLYDVESKHIKIRELIKQQKRCLIFCSLTDAADKICLSSHHSKSFGNNLQLFIDEEINHLSCVNLGGTGITYPNLDTILFDGIQGSEVKAIQKCLRACNLEEDENKIAKIIIVISDLTVEDKWLLTALQSFDKTKIKNL